MTATHVHESVTVEELQARLGREIGVSRWFEVFQDRIDRFADLTEDHQWIHVDRERAVHETPFGGTIAHGFLSLSLLSAMAYDVVPTLRGAVMGINYGFDKLRFVTPVRAGSRVRGHFTLTRIEPRKAQQLLIHRSVSVEIEGVEKPALVCDWLGMAVLG
ncbi:MAG TPA: MaoC family dehydratase [Nevskiaceae bacterium]|nr:MaoC family dehydratase [Nevskiaceae bacterium]